MTKKLIFCLGTGRCGTSSMAALLNSQNSALFTHELFPILPWEEESKRSEHAKQLVQFKFLQVTHQAHNCNIVGDAGSYYLPYVEVFIRSLANNGDFDLKFIILKRDKTKTVESFKTKFARQNNNPLQNHNGLKNEWDEAFPKYNNFWTLEESIEKYYDDYYNVSEKLAKKYPSIVKIFNTEVLNTEEGLVSLFKHLDINNPKLIKNIRKNTG